MGSNPTLSASSFIFNSLALGDTIRDTILHRKESCVDPALIYAFKKTGRLVTEKNQRFLSQREMAEWTDAVEEYRLCVDAGRIA